MVAIKKKFPTFDDGSIDVDRWLQHAQKMYPLETIELLQKTILLAKETSKGLTTFYGQACLEQSLEMAEIILNLKLDSNAVAAAILTSTLQHTSLTIEIIKEKLGDEVSKLCAGVLQMNIINTLQANINKTRNQAQIDRLRKTFLAMVSDIRVVLIKLAERTCIMRGIKNINPTERKRLAQETMDIYAPLANRLGIGQLKWELEDISFHYIDSET
ncbi:MAG TPA: HD domain-containing protein, partial [Gammaproteobacteria bacterium]|nr:HD domain-containing protein [Gammaproteobacteria bacterium]